MKVQPLISVVVPVYNAEKYLDKCVKSILNQNYKNLEILLIDDGSKDNSYEICRQYEGIDKRVYAYTQENAGPSAARNKGLDLATGEYIAFVDSDDFISEEMYEVLLRNLMEHEVDLSLCGMQKIYCDGSIRPYYEGLRTKKIECMDNVFFENSYITFAPVDKLYPRKLIGDIRFDESIKMCEDQKFVYELLKKAKAVFYDERALYNIRMTDGSLSRSKATRYHLAMIDVCDYIIGDTESSRLRKQGELYKAQICLSFFVPNYNNGEFLEEDINYINSIISKNKFNIIRFANCKTKIKLVLFYVAPWLLKKIMKREKQ